MDAITLLKDDHKTVESLFKQFEKAGDRAVKTKRQLADQMIKELTTQALRPERGFASAGGYLATWRAEGPDIATVRYQGGDVADVFTALAKDHQEVKDKLRDTITGRGTD